MISVVVPVYNSNDYLKRCLDSVVGQSFKDLEIICINDCSTDGSEAVLRDFERSDQRVRVISLPENHGCPYARNLGIDEARGEYIYFMDSDDWLDLDYLEEMYDHARSTGQDVVVNRNWYYEYDDTSKRKTGGSTIVVGDNGEFLPPVVVQSSFYPVVWTRLYRLKYLKDNDVRSPLVKGGIDDNYFTSLAEILQPRSYVFSGPYYHYYQRDDSLSHQGERSLIYIQNFRLFLGALRERSIPPASAKRFFIIDRFGIYGKESFSFIKSFFTDVEPDVLAAPDLYSWFDFYTMEAVLSCPDFETFCYRFPLGLRFGSVEWEFRGIGPALSKAVNVEAFKVPSRNLLSPYRFDIFCRLFYIRHRKEASRAAAGVYMAALKCMAPDGVVAAKKEINRLYASHVESFDNLITRSNDDDDALVIPSIPVGNNGIPLDGLDQLAALAYLGKDVLARKFSYVYEGIYGYRFFLERGMPKHIADMAAREGMNWIERPSVLCVWPEVEAMAPEVRAVYSCDYSLGKKSYFLLRSKIDPSWKSEVIVPKHRFKVRFVFYSGEETPLKYDCFQVLDDVNEVKRVADLILTKDGRRSWYHGGGLFGEICGGCSIVWNNLSSIGRSFLRNVKNHLANCDSKTWIRFYRYLKKGINH